MICITLLFACPFSVEFYEGLELFLEFLGLVCIYFG